MWAFAIFNFTLGKVTFTFNGSVFMVYDVFPFGLTIFKRQRFRYFVFFIKVSFSFSVTLILRIIMINTFEIAAFIERFKYRNTLSVSEVFFVSIAFKGYLFYSASPPLFLLRIPDTSR